ncbi:MULTISPECIES: KinB-signaling pathway activation protein [unclassified Thermoactinomyces]|jgi:KinB signaling pathway activation protein|uniref:KinB-signaling pathway activation protein n=1 Tax=unclassified Thermoactinomyces TaxID=2634588 RepID=UPI0018DC039E|nr:MULTISPECIES: KinB-signaling pathway activation protein [unclassified Thermoactinomyces]MBH8604881.1 KinB-signaling pathway activation protein [Thermoactinomyces sp. CICC 10522]MBH8607293.1 KinB-signaling pathway activation protein [Thermoactinomyces sp. CICC 10521]
MTLKKLLYWFWSTLFIGGASALILSSIFEWSAGSDLFGPIPKQLLLSLTLAALAELGFFSFLVFNWLAKGLIRQKSAYDLFLLFLMLIVLGDWVYLNLSKFNGESLWLHLLVPFTVLLAAFIVAGLKVKWTQKTAYVPTFFFMVVATVIEAVPTFHTKAGEIPLLMILHTVIVLLICNAWQILQLHRLAAPGTNRKLLRKETKQKPAPGIK